MAAAYLTPFFYHKEGQAVRAFKDIINQPDHLFSRNPEDYTLYQVGEWDEITGEVTHLDISKKIINGLPCVNPPEQAPPTI